MALIQPLVLPKPVALIQPLAKRTGNPLKAATVGFCIKVNTDRQTFQSLQANAHADSLLPVLPACAQDAPGL